MPAFIALAVLLAVAVLAAVLWPLRRGAPALLPVAVVSLGLAAFALYRIVGTPAALEQSARAAPTTLDEAVAALEATLARNPNEPEGWRLLGRSYASQQRHAQAQEAFATAVKLMPNDPTLLVEAAQARLYANPQRRLDTQAVALLQRALAIDPGHQRALWFRGVAERQDGQAAAAVRTWESLLARVDPAAARSLRVQIDGARAEAGMPPLAAATPQQQRTPNSGVTVEVSLDPAFASRVRLSGDAVVFVIARVPGSPMPVAVERHALSTLPLTVTLDDSDSLMPAARLSALDEVELLARVSSSGDASRRQGDAESRAVRIQLPAAQSVPLVIGAASD